MSGEERIKRILCNTEVIAVVGLSPKQGRPSHTVSGYLQNNGYKIIPVYPREDAILNEKVFRSLSDIKEKVDMVLIFRKAEEVLPIVAESLKLNPGAIWMQEGIINYEAAELAGKHGIDVVMDKCIYREHMKL